MIKENSDEIYLYTPDISGYKDAVWHFILEHSDVSDSGALFTKFHSSGRRNFENRILARWKYQYHREDPVLKGKDQEEKREEFEAQKFAKKDAYKKSKTDRMASREEVQKALKEVEEWNTNHLRRVRGRSFKTLFENFIHKSLIRKLLWDTEAD